MKRGRNKKNVQHVNKVHKLKCLYTNSDSLLNKRLELEAAIVLYVPHIVCITEFSPKATNTPVQEVELQIEGYDLFSNVGSHKRGVLIYTHKNLQASPSTADELWSSEEGCWCGVSLNEEDRLLIGCVYRSPNSPESNNTSLLESIKKICEEVKFTHLLLCGDFNIPEIDRKEEVSLTNSKHLAFRFMECIRDCFLYQHVQNPTHSRKNQTENILDLIFTNEDGMIEDIKYEAPLGKSDHLVLKFDYMCYKKETQVLTSKFNYNKGNYEQLRQELALYDWQEEFENLNVEEGWECFEKKMTIAMERSIPKMKTSNKKRKPLWMNEKVLTKLKKKSEAFKRYMETREGEEYQKYARARNQAKWACREAVREFEKNIAKESKTNPKAFFNYTKSKFKTTSSIPDLDTSKGGKTKGEQQKANLLNEFFSSVFTREDMSNIPAFPKKDLEEEMSNLEITEEMVKKKLQKLKPNKSGELDGISPRVLIEATDPILTPITIIMNKSLREGRLPQRWKDAVVAPIFKKGKKSSPGNYRPVSLTSVICKVMESVIRDHIMDHLYRNNLLTDCQHGFVRNRSCLTQLLECLDVWTEMLDTGGSVDVVYMDYAKAFDKVAHARLLRKLQGYGITNQALDWIGNFLHGRRQKVKVNGEESKWADVLSGVPQGSVLGPVLFVCYINDLPDEIHTNVKLFADDTKIYADVSKKNGSEELQEDITRLDEWASKWQLSFNSSKCKVMHIGNKNPQKSYNMRQDSKTVEIEKTEMEKDIGVHVDNDLKFDKHVEIQCGKANKILGMIRRAFTYIDTNSMKHLYTALIRPILEYGHAVTYPRFKKSEILLENVQHRATKMVPELKDLDYEDRLDRMDLQSLYYRRDRGDMVECYKMTHGSYDIKPILKLDPDITRRGHSYKLRIVGSQKEVRHHFFSIRVVKKWNSLPESVVNAPSLNSFKSRLDKLWNIYKYSQMPPPPCKNDLKATLSDTEEEIVEQALA